APHSRGAGRTGAVRAGCRPVRAVRDADRLPRGHASVCGEIRLMRSASVPAVGALARPRLAGRSQWAAMVAVVAVAGLVLRVWIYRSALGVPNSDEAVVGLMVRHAMHGDISVFFWGSSYGGPQEVLLDVPFFWIFGSGYLALRIVSIGLNAVAAVIAWRVGRRVFGEAQGAAAGALLWLWPPFNLFQLTQQQSFFAANVFYCALLLLLALRIVEKPDRLRVAVFGFVVGFAFWQTPHIVPVAIPVIAWTAWRARAAIRHAWIGAAACVLGASPWLLWNAFHDWRSLGVHTDL